MTNGRKRYYSLIILFCGGYLLMNYPLLSLFNLPRLLWGFPILYIYIFSAWLLLIILVVWITSSSNRLKEPSKQE